MTHTPNLFKVDTPPPSLAGLEICLGNGVHDEPVWVFPATTFLFCGLGEGGRKGGQEKPYLPGTDVAIEYR